MEKVFSVEKFKEWCEMSGLTKERINVNCELWANKCDGLTKEEMNKLGYVFNDDWAIEVEVEE